MKNECMVLVVEDDKAIREATIELLALEGYVALGASNGREALDTLERMVDKPPCLILLDLMMPVMDGWDFLAVQRATAPLAEIPVCVVTAVTDPKRAPDVKHRLGKPIDIEALLSVVNTYCH